MDNGIKIELINNRDKISKSELNTFRIGIIMTNNTNETLTFDISKLQLYVNNKRSFAWDLTVQNGTYLSIKIKSGKSEKVVWPLGEAIFSSTGNYQLALKINNQIIDTNKITVVN
ncbi:hypothetical protein [Aquimarina brevivitae]|uniref:Intracellular proteinase inhibitor BsuPI domain-containing protein n=1 Tax=Aquimarina brevivitae TaxID=323412 RepID=A0A4Q7NYH9_9FLAO|nr:hypothetical protein [Aquimarina brevivitae]RZS92501.1 hypothetical protein EV197_2639 [Aquimarina brevivitae]